MKLQDIFSQLTYGELKQQGLGGFDEGGIQEENYPEIVSHLNLALLNVYTRFPISEKEWILPLVAGQSIYDLDADVLRINAAFDSEGNEIPLNDENADISIYTPSYNTIQIPTTITGSVTLIYRAKPTVITAPDPEADAVAIADFLAQDVALPEFLTEATFAYIEYRVAKATGGEMGMAQSGVAKQQYEMLCLEVEKRNLMNTAVTPTSIKPSLGGWK